MNDETMEATESVQETAPISTEAVEGSQAGETIPVESTPHAAQSLSNEVALQIRDDIVHADLFGSFLICGAIVAAVLFWRWHR